MFKIGQFILLILLSFSLVSCGQKAGKTSAKLSFNTSFLSGLAGSDGGVMLYGKNLSTGQYFSRKVTDTNSAEELVLDNGAWDFAAIAWDGDVNLNSTVDGAEPLDLTGRMKCSVLRKELKGGDDVLSFKLAISGCADPLIGDPTWYYDAATGVKPLTPRTCVGIEQYSSGCLASVGDYYRVSVMEYDLGGNQKVAYQSQCNPLGSASVSRFPLLRMDSPRSKTEIEIFTGGGCTTFEKKIIPFGKGSLGSGNYIAYPWGGAVHFDMELDVCDTVTFGTGGTGFIGSDGYQIICNPTQFQAINGSNDVRLGRNIDFIDEPAVTDNITSANLNKNFDGNGHVVSNAVINTSGSASNVGFFPILGGAGSSMIMSDVTFENITISGAATALTDAGVIAGKATDVIFEDVFIKTASVSAGASSINIGSALGTLSYKTTTKEFENSIEVADSSITAISATSVGAVAGVLSFGNGSATTDIYVSGFSSINNEVLKQDTQEIGGAIGKVSFTGGTANSGIEDVSVKSFNLIENGSGSTKTRFGGAFGNLLNTGASVNTASHILVVDTHLGHLGNPLALTKQVGGIAGSVTMANLEKVKFQGSIRNADPVANTASPIGGIVGFMNSTGDITDFISVPNIYASNSSQIGGVIGKAGAGSTLKRGRVSGVIGSSNETGCYGECGGVVGSSATSGVVSINDTYAKVDIYSNLGTAGGMFGYVAGAKFDSVAYEGYIEGNNQLGGLIGFEQATGGFPGKNLLVKATLKPVGVDIGSYAGVKNSGAIIAQNAYFFVKKKNPDSSLSNDVSIYSGTPITNSFSTCYDLATSTGSYQECNNRDEATMLSAATRALFPTGLLSPWKDVNPGVDGYAMSFKRYEFLNSIGGFTSAGIDDDPFVITTPSQWNNIKDNPRLMGSSFMLGGPLNFSGISFEPIGSKMNPFFGSLRGNNQTISNIDFDDTGTSEPTGLIRVLGPGGRINPGTRITGEVEKLYLNNVHMQTDSNMSGLVVGLVTDDNDEPVVVDNLRLDTSSLLVDSTTATAGGVIGAADIFHQDSHFINIKATAMDVTASSGVTFLGGVFGQFHDRVSGYEVHDILFDGDIYATNSITIGGFAGEGTGLGSNFEKIVTSGDIYGGSSGSHYKGSFFGNTKFSSPGLILTNSKPAMKLHGMPAGLRAYGCFVGKAESGTINIANSLALCGDVVTATLSALPLMITDLGIWDVDANTPALSIGPAMHNSTVANNGDYFSSTTGPSQTHFGIAWSGGGLLGEVAITDGVTWYQADLGTTNTYRATIGYIQGASVNYSGVKFVGNIGNHVASSLERIHPTEVYNSSNFSGFGGPWEIEDGFIPTLPIENEL